MESNLFIELAEEQQEMVAGGGDGLFNRTTFSQRIALQTGTTKSGPDGSTSTSEQGSDVRDTSGLQIGFLDFSSIVFPA